MLAERDLSSLTEHDDDEINPMILNQRQLAEKMDQDPKNPVLA